MAVCSLVRALTQFGWVDVSASKSAPRKSSDGHMCAITPNTVDIAVKFSGMDHFLNTRLCLMKLFSEFTPLCGSPHSNLWFLHMHVNSAECRAEWLFRASSERFASMDAVRAHRLEHGSSLWKRWLVKTRTAWQRQERERELGERTRTYVYSPGTLHVFDISFC